MIPTEQQLRLSALDQAVRISLQRTSPLGIELEAEDNEAIVARAEAFYTFLTS